jgi:hypothetical protein
MQAHIDPCAVLLGPCLVGFTGAFLQHIGDLVVDVLLLEHLLVRELDKRGRQEEPEGRAAAQAASAPAAGIPVRGCVGARTHTRGAREPRRTAAAREPTRAAREPTRAAREPTRAARAGAHAGQARCPAILVLTGRARSTSC